MKMLTSSGREISLLDPQPEMFDIEDIAHALSQICRFAGNTQRFYSVAQHCLVVSELAAQVDERYALPGLCHDFGEIVGDIPTPFKQLFPQIRDIEDRIMEAIAIRFDVSFDDYHVIKRADLVAMATEKRDLLPGTPPLDILTGIDPAPFRIFPMAPAAARQALLNRFYELTARRAMQA